MTHLRRQMTASGVPVPSSAGVIAGGPDTGGARAMIGCLDQIGFLTGRSGDQKVPGSEAARSVWPLLCQKEFDLLIS
jgi:hypothetical protein